MANYRTRCKPLFILLLLLWSTAPLFAQEAGVQAPAQTPQQGVDAETAEELEKIAQEISETTMSPFCPGRTLSACPSEQARQLRIQVLEWLKKGYSPEAVHNQLLTIYGDEVLGTPKAKGFGLMAWIMPSIFVVVCLLLVVLLLRLSKRGANDDEEKAEPLSEEMEERISQELENRK